MATLNSKGNNTNRKSYLLSVTPIDYSLTEGTNIPPPSPSKQSPLDPPASGGGPLKSHPATPPNGEAQQETVHSTMHHEADRERADSFRTPTSPASNAQYSSSPQDRRRPGGVRKLFSLTNLRSSFSSSRTSLAQSRPSNDTYPQPHQPQYNGVKRPSSPSMASTAATSSSLAPTTSQLRQKKAGGNWFKRKSGFFNLNGELEAVDENQRPETRDSKRLKESSSPAPLLPEIGTLGGAGSVGGGDLGWDERAFKR